MGLFDYVNFEMDCPKCGDAVRGFQTKDGDVYLNTVELEAVTTLYSQCRCGHWIELTRRTVNPTKRGEVSRSRWTNCWTAHRGTTMRKTENIDVKLPVPLCAELQAVAKDAGLATETVLKLALATEVRRWKRESDIRWERDSLLTFAKEVAIGAYKPRELRKQAQAVVSEMSHVPPNAGNQRGT